MKTVERFSAGGVAFQPTEVGFEIALIKTTKEGRWQLPKGHIDPGETAEQAATREVREEAGVECEIVAAIDNVDYWFVDRWGKAPVRTHKYVHFFLMKFVRGSTDDHDHEVTEARWFGINDAIEKLSFPAEKMILRKASEMLS